MPLQAQNCRSEYRIRGTSTIDKPHDAFHQRRNVEPSELDVDLTYNHLFSDLMLVLSDGVVIWWL
jgi:hypothetical protein